MICAARLSDSCTEQQGMQKKGEATTIQEANREQVDTIKLLSRFLQHRDPKSWAQILLQAPADLMPRQDPPLQKENDAVGGKIKELLEQGLIHIKMLLGSKLQVYDMDKRLI